MRASALNGDCPCSSRWWAASRIFSGTVHSPMMVFTRFPQAKTVMIPHSPSRIVAQRGRRGQRDLDETGGGNRAGANLDATTAVLGPDGPKTSGNRLLLLGQVLRSSR